MTKLLQWPPQKPALETAMGIRANVMRHLLMTLVVVTTVASLESVGNILVVTMLIVPAAATYLITNRLPDLAKGASVGSSKAGDVLEQPATLLAEGGGVETYLDPIPAEHG